MSTLTILSSRSHLNAGDHQTVPGRYQLPTPNAVAQLAHANYVAQGREDGHDVQHWLEAEAHLHLPYRCTCLRDAHSS